MGTTFGQGRQKIGHILESLERRTLLAGGFLDSTFSSDGRQTHDGGDDSAFSDVKVQPDGKVVTAGRLYMNYGPTPETAFGVFRYTASGVLDSTFGGGDGIAELPESWDLTLDPISLSLLPDGKILAGGLALQNGIAGVARFTSAGLPDTTLNGTGTLTTGLINAKPIHHPRVVAQSDGKFYVVGWDDNHSTAVEPGVDVYRFNANGTPDGSYGNGGSIYLKTSGGATPVDITLTSSGKLLLAGIWSDNVHGTSGDFYARVTTDGKPDSTFGGDGLIENALGSPATALLPLSNDQFLVCGGAWSPGGQLWSLLAKFRSNGSRDSSFGDNATGIKKWVHPYHYQDLAAQSDGKLLVIFNTASDIGITRLSPAGVPDPTFGTAGTTITSIVGTEVAARIAVDSSNRAVLAGYVGILEQGLLERYTADTVPVVQTPFKGSPFAIGSSAAVIEFEDFDNGGESIAFHDIEKTNLGGKYRTAEGVDIQSTTDTGGGYNIGYVKAGEWLEYTINVASAGNYDFDFRVASTGSNARFHCEIDGSNKTGALTLPNTAGSQTWKTLTKTGVSLPAGKHVLRVAFDANSTSGSVGNFNKLTIKPSGQQPPPPPPASSITVQAEDFDAGAEGVAYHDLDSANQGGKYRSTGVDIQSTTDTGGGYNISYVKAGEWLQYTINVAATADYTLDIRAAAGGSNGKFHVEIDGNDATGAWTLPNTGGWQNWTTLSKSGIHLTAGTHVFRLRMDANGSTGSVGNFNWLRLTPA